MLHRPRRILVVPVQGYRVEGKCEEPEEPDELESIKRIQVWRYHDCRDKHLTLRLPGRDHVPLAFSLRKLRLNRKIGTGEANTQEKDRSSTRGGGRLLQKKKHMLCTGRTCVRRSFIWTMPPGSAFAGCSTHTYNGKHNQAAASTRNQRCETHCSRQYLQKRVPNVSPTVSG